MQSVAVVPALVIFLALPAGVAGQVPAKNPADVVAALAGKPPRVLSELEAVVGSLRRDPAKWESAVGPLLRVAPSPAVAKARAGLFIDTFHQDPQKVKDPALSQWELEFTSGREAARRLLATRFPKPAQFRGDDGRPVVRFGDFYFSALDGPAAFRLAWYRTEPLFAVPQRTEQETVKLIASLAAVANAGFTRQAITANLGPLTRDAQEGADVVRSGTWTLEYKPAGAAKPESVVILFKRPLPCRDLLSKIGFVRPGVIAPDTHQQTRTVIDLANRLSPVTGSSVPAVKGYGVRISVKPEGLIRTRIEWPGSPVWSAQASQILSLDAFLPGRGK